MMRPSTTGKDRIQTALPVGCAAWMRYTLTLAILFAPLCLCACRDDQARGRAASNSSDPAIVTWSTSDARPPGPSGSADGGTDRSTSPAPSTVRPSNPSADHTGPISASAAPIEITFDDINLRLQADMVYRPWMLTDRARELDGQRVRISGYILPDVQQNNIRQFVLLRNKECKFGPGGQADHLINVTLVDGVTTSYRDKPVEVQGVLKINPFHGPDGNTWSIYDMVGEKVEVR